MTETWKEVDEIECTKCGWTGLAQELLCRPEDDDKPVAESAFDVCPGCGGVSTFEDFEEEG